MTCAYWGFVLMSLHLGIHWRMIMAATGKQSSRLDSGKPQHIRSWILRLLGVAVALYGLYAFVKRNIASYFFLQVHFVFFDYSEPVIFYNVTRIETYSLPKAAVREAVYNAIIHSNYAALVPIQIRIHEDAVYISNDCVFPVGWTVETLMERHRSQPYNPNIANGFFRAGYVETWGRGIEKICEACKKHGVPMPEYTLHLEDIMVKFTPLGHQDILKDQNVLINVPLNVLINDPLEKEVLSAIEENSHITQAQLSIKLNRSDRQIRRVLKELREKGIIDRIGSRKSGQWIVK